MSKDHIKSDLPVTTDWWNENVRDVYFNGCHIGQLARCKVYRKMEMAKCMEKRF